MSLSPTVLKFAAAGLVIGTIAFIISGIAHRPAGTSVGTVVVNVMLFRTPATTVIGAAVGFIWEKAFGPLGGQSSSPTPTESSESETQATPVPRAHSPKSRRRRKAKR